MAGVSSKRPQAPESLDKFLGVLARITPRLADSASGLQHAWVQHLMLEDTGVCLHGETREPRYPQTRVAQELAHEEFVATGGSSIWAVVLEV